MDKHGRIFAVILVLTFFRLGMPQMGIVEHIGHHVSQEGSDAFNAWMVDIGQILYVHVLPTPC